jgi:hypothetical protein
MSWEANTWAVKQRMKLPQEQLVLIVLGNCADADAVAFSTWPGRDLEQIEGKGTPVCEPVKVQA